MKHNEHILLWKLSLVQPTSQSQSVAGHKTVMNAYLAAFWAVHPPANIFAGLDPMMLVDGRMSLLLIPHGRWMKI